MSHVRSLCLAASLAAPLVLAACPGRGLTNWEKERLQEQTADDLDSALDELAGLGGSIDDAAAARGTFEIGLPGYAGCTRHYLYDGEAAAGTVEMELQGVPCAASLTLNDVLYRYTIDEWSWSGGWAAFDASWWDVQWSGAAASTLTIEGSARNDGDYDASWSMNAATARTDGEGALASWSIDLTYGGFLDRVWEVEVAKDEAGVVAGTLSSDDGIVCVVSGQDYDYVVDCD